MIFKAYSYMYAQNVSFEEDSKSTSIINEKEG